MKTLRIACFAWLSTCLSMSVLAWPPAPYGVPPHPAQQRLHQQLMQDIEDRVDGLLQQMAEAADDSAISPQGRFRLSGENFPRLSAQPPLDRGRVWRVVDGQGAYRETLPLRFETLPVETLGSAQSSPELSEVFETLERWRDFLSSRPRPDIDRGVWNNLSEYYQDIQEMIPEVTEDVVISGSRYQHYLYIARVDAGAAVKDGESGIVGIALSSVDPSRNQAYLSFVTSNPYAMVRQPSRAPGVVGSAGQPLMDYSLRQLSQTEGVTRIALEAQNNRVGVFVLARGFEPNCVEEGISNPLFRPGAGNQEAESGLINPAFRAADEADGEAGFDNPYD